MSARDLMLDGDLTILNAESVQEKLSRFLEDEPDLQATYEVVVDGEATLDLSLIQLLVAAYRTAHEAGLKLQIRSPMPEQLEHSLRVVGLLQPDETVINSERMGTVR